MECISIFLLDVGVPYSPADADLDDDNNFEQSNTDSTDSIQVMHALNIINSPPIFSNFNLTHS